MLKVYLAGPQVFFADADRAFAEQKRICAKWGFEGVSPADNQANLRELESPHAIGMAIYRADRATMDACDLAIANLTPWHPHPADPEQLPIAMDTGTAMEIGYLRGTNKPIWAFTNTTKTYGERLR